MERVSSFSYGSINCIRYEGIISAGMVAPLKFCVNLDYFWQLKEEILRESFIVNELQF